MRDLSAIYKEVLNTIPDAIIIIDRDYKVIFANRAMLEMCGASVEIVSGKRCYELLHHCKLPCAVEDSTIRCPHAEVLNDEGSSPLFLTHIHILPDGTKRFMEIAASLMKDGPFLLEVMRDVTERVLLEKTLREVRDEFIALVEHSLVGIYLIQDGIFRYVNPRLAELFGYTKDELINRMGPEDLVYPGDWHIVKENIRKRVKGEVESVNYRFRGLRKDGSVFDVEVYGSRTIYEDRPAIIGTLLDITEKKRLEDETSKRLEELQGFYDIAIKRELKMIELKKEIERLKKELNSRG